MEQAKPKKINRSQREKNNYALVAAVITQTFFPFLVANKKNSYFTYDFIVEMTDTFIYVCEKEKYVLGKDPIKDREGIVNWVKDTLSEHPDFKDALPPKGN